MRKRAICEVDEEHDETLGLFTERCVLCSASYFKATQHGKRRLSHVHGFARAAVAVGWLSLAGALGTSRTQNYGRSITIIDVRAVHYRS